jgi:hypothetical protein
MMTTDLTCRVCGKPIVRQHNTGRPPLTCSNICRVARHRGYQLTYEQCLQQHEDRFERVVERLEHLLTKFDSSPKE